MPNRTHRFSKTTNSVMMYLLAANEERIKSSRGNEDIKQNFVTREYL